MTVSDFRVAVNDAHDGVIHTQGRVIDELTEDQQKYYGLDESSFPEAPEDGLSLIHI